MEGSLVQRFKNICVFCGSNLGKYEKFVKAANNLGRVLDARKLHLIYGGDSLRLMGCLATTAHLGGSQVLGIIHRALTTSNITGKIVGEERVVLCMHECMKTMLDNVDAFIDLPDGLGILKEIFQIESWTQLNIH
ncbi:hypothetical protein REPUB_Repub18cG0030500 [Reevesia pubescens]